MTCVLDGLEHAITDEVEVGVGPGRYGAVCGREVIARPLVCPPGRRCKNCHTAIDARVSRPQRNVRQPRVPLDWARRST